MKCYLVNFSKHQHSICFASTRQNAEDGKILEFAIWEKDTIVILVVLGRKLCRRAGLLFG